MKTYNTIENILNDHELMNMPLSKIKDFLSKNITYGTPLHKSIPGGEWSFQKSEWLKSEYERRQKEKKFEFENTPCDIKDFRNENHIIMEKKPNLIPFDLEKAKAGAKIFQDATSPKEAKIISVNGEDRYPLIVLIKREDGIEYTEGFTLQGTFYSDRTDKSSDLFIESEPLPELWANLYRRKDGSFFMGSVYKNEKEAIEGLTNKGDFHTHIKTIKL
jgi:hypothetical protein